MVAASKSRDATVTTAGAAAAVPLGTATAGTRPATTTASTVPTTRRVLGCRMFRPFANVSMYAHVASLDRYRQRFSKTFSMTSYSVTVSYTHLRAHETRHDLVCRLLLEKQKI